MDKQSVTNSVAATLLGKRVESSYSYNPSCLVAVPRFENRQQYGIKSEALPFRGYDVWHCYEFSTMTKNNIPVTRVLKLKYSCDSEYIIESKSLKLYLNSFNMSNFGASTDESLNICRQLIENDLSEKLQTLVAVEFLTDNSEKVQIFDNYVNLMSLVKEERISTSAFKESPEILEIEQVNDKKYEYYLKYDSLRSNCRVTHQPDFGDVFIYYESKKVINYDSLVKYLISFRSEYHFHEECCEMIYKRLYDLLDSDDKLMVCALYTRRGGIDISPVRYSKGLTNSDIEALENLSVFARCGIKQ